MASPFTGGPFHEGCQLAKPRVPRACTGRPGRARRSLYRHGRLVQTRGPGRGVFKASYGYAVFPTIGKGGFVVGAAHGEGRVYRQGRYIGNTSLTQVSFGFQFGGQAYSEMVFFQDQAALKRFESGDFSLSADVNAVAITASVSASAGTAGTEAGASGTESHAIAAGHYQNGVAVFTIAKGGLMYQAAVAGQKFSFEPVR